MNGQPSFRLGYVPALDGLRGVAVLAVMAVHFKVPFARGGFLGVDIFFVLSGFLITSLLVSEWQRTGRISLKHFYARRALRLLPALGLLLAALSPVVPLLQIVATLAYLANWVIAFGALPMTSGPLGHTWSLSIEEQFYLLWPLCLVLLLGSRLPSRLFPLIPLALALVESALRLGLFYAVAPWPRIYYATDTHADGILVGSAVALAVAFGRMPRSPAWQRVVHAVAALFAVSLLYLLVDSAPFLGPNAAWLLVHIILPLFPVGVAALILSVVVYPSRVASLFLGLPPLVLLGRVSYGLYLWHLPVHFFLDGLGIAAGTPEGTTLRILVSCAIAAISYRYVESPALRLKDRLRASVRPQGNASPKTVPS